MHSCAQRRDSADFRLAKSTTFVMFPGIVSKHPLAVLVAEPSPITDPPDEKQVPSYDPVSQVQIPWNDIENHMEILCSDKHTGDPDTRSATTEDWWHRANSDDDTDDSGT